MTPLPPLPDHGSAFPGDGAAGPVPAFGAFGAEVEIFLAEFNSSQPSDAVVSLRKRLAAVRGDNFVLRERVATLERELLATLERAALLDNESQSARDTVAFLQRDNQCLREYIATLEGQNRSHLEALFELRQAVALREQELGAIKASVSWRLVRNLRGAVRRCRRWARKLLPLGNR
ncbi:MAG TPA: hypothetical protein VEL76_29570 [Gemmataceae bacterium]|nr:hypothetical protein [Gemmataceae bacterium]